MKLRWLTFGILAASAVLVAQMAPPQGQPYPPQSQPGYPGPGPQGPGPQPSGPQGDEGPQDEPGRAVARLGILNGDANVRRGDSSDWVAAAVNAPLMAGDELSVSSGGRAEVQLDAANFVRLTGDTDLRFADLDNGQFNVQLAHGTMIWRVLRDGQSQAEISTPLVAVHPGRQSEVRVEVQNDGVTRVIVRRGDAEVSTPRGTEHVNANSTMIIQGNPQGNSSDPEFQIVAAGGRDEWDGWSDQRDSALLRAQSPRYVTQDISGVEDLDTYGNWNYDPSYGWVWNPTVASSWAPYQNGQWAWEDYYGWTWVDYDPWGWAPFHYGYWYNRVGFGWSWYPGARGVHTWWRPAMVGFFGWGGGSGFGFGFGNIGWCPLAPREVFHPWYRRGGFRGGANVNINVVRNANIFNSYRNAGVANGVTAVSAADFQRGNFRNRIGVDRGQLQQASLVRGAVPMTPTDRNRSFSDRVASVQTPRSGIASNQRFFNDRSGRTGANISPTAAQRTPFVQQQAAVRSAFAGQSRSGGVPNGAAPSRTAGAPAFQRFNNNVNTGGTRAVQNAPRSFQNQASPVQGQPSPAPQSPQQSRPGWNRFEGQQQTPEMQQRQGSGSGGQGFNREPNSSEAQPRQFNDAQPPQTNNPQPRQYTNPQPRQYQVSPPIIRERAQPQYSQPRQQAPSAQGGGFRGGQPQRSAPAGGGRNSGGGERQGGGQRGRR